MDDAVLFRGLDAFPEPAFSALTHEAFSDYEPSRLLTDALQEEAAAREILASPKPQALRIGAFEKDRLVGWTYARPDGVHLQMVNSGVAADHRRQGIYSRLVELTIDHAIARGYVAILSRHAANNNAVLIAKLRRGFFVSGFEYSEVYGPLVRLTYLTGELRRRLHRARSAPIRRLDGADG
jgi:ribosomal protein S18 acetylase RimI-like enzyme